MQQLREYRLLVWVAPQPALEVAERLPERVGVTSKSIESLPDGGECVEYDADIWAVDHTAVIHQPRMSARTTPRRGFPTPRLILARLQMPLKPEFSAPGRLISESSERRNWFKKPMGEAFLVLDSHPLHQFGRVWERGQYRPTR